VKCAKLDTPFLTNTGTVQIGDGGPLKTVVPAGTYSMLGGTTAINEASVVTFAGQLPSGPHGVFIGPNPTTDTVVKVGDVIPGLGTVITVGVGEEAINDLGQVAFVVRCDRGDGTFPWAIVRANPIRPATTTTLAVSPSPGVLGQPVRLTATVTATTGIPSGQVEFFDGATSLGTASLTSGVATLQTTALALGAHGLLADFRGSTGSLPSLHLRCHSRSSPRRHCRRQPDWWPRRLSATS
jgi:trimeric autotransporter adhesin